jgi:hypothetical protein
VKSLAREQALMWEADAFEPFSLPGEGLKLEAARFSAPLQGEGWAGMVLLQRLDGVAGEYQVNTRPDPHPNPSPGGRGA